MEGKLGARKVIVAPNSWADYVCEKVIGELTLYMIEQNKISEEQQKRIELLKRNRLV